MSKVNYIEIRDKKTGKVTTVELGGAGGGGTSDTAYVSDSTLYIEEGTTAGGGSSENILEIDVDFNAVDTENETVMSILDALFDFFVETPTGISGGSYSNATILNILISARMLNFKENFIQQNFMLPNCEKVNLTDLGITQTITYEQLKNVDGIRFHIVKPETQEKYSTLILKPIMPYIKLFWGLNYTALFVTLNGDKVLNCVLSEIAFKPDNNQAMAYLSIESSVYGI